MTYTKKLLGYNFWLNMVIDQILIFRVPFQTNFVLIQCPVFKRFVVLILQEGI